jgi:hypothetical protein
MGNPSRPPRTIRMAQRQQLHRRVPRHLHHHTRRLPTLNDKDMTSHRTPARSLMRPNRTSCSQGRDAARRHDRIRPGVSKRIRRRTVLNVGFRRLLPAPWLPWVMGGEDEATLALRQAGQGGATDRVSPARTPLGPTESTSDATGPSYRRCE